jgi:predicted ATPase
LPEAHVDQIYERAGGVPLFVEEFTKMVQESGVPDNEWAERKAAGPAWARDSGHASRPGDDARVDRMEGERELHQLAATLGREFSHELLSAVAALDEPTDSGKLAELMQAEILYAKGRPPQCSYIFKHALLEDALYNRMVKGKRQQFHRRVAEVLEGEVPADGPRRGRSCWHTISAKLASSEKAVAYWLKAGLRSRERFCRGRSESAT